MFAHSRSINLRTSRVLARFAVRPGRAEEGFPIPSLPKALAVPWTGSQILPLPVREGLQIPPERKVMCSARECRIPPRASGSFGSLRPTPRPVRDWQIPIWPAGGDAEESAFYYNIHAGAGLNSIALPVETWGRVTQIGAGYLYTSDGVHLTDWTSTGEEEHIRLRVMCDPTGYAPAGS